MNSWKMAERYEVVHGESVQRGEDLKLADSAQRNPERKEKENMVHEKVVAYSIFHAELYDEDSMKPEEHE